MTRLSTGHRSLLVATVTWLLLPSGVALAGPGAGTTVANGDANRDGALNYEDIGAFSLAVRDPAAYMQTYRCTDAQRLAMGDFTGDGSLSTADIRGFSNLLIATVDSRGGDGGSKSLTTRTLSSRTGGSGDLDIDSDNDAGALNWPSRSGAEDAVEAQVPGKFIGLNDDYDPNDPNDTLDVEGDPDLVPMLFQIVPDGVSTLTKLDYEVEYTDEYANLYRIPLRLDPRDPNDPNNPPDPNDPNYVPHAIVSETTYEYEVFLLGDMDGDGDAGVFDITAFTLAITDKEEYEATHHLRADQVGDCNNDGVCDGFDVDAFVALITGADVYLPVQFRVEGTVGTAEGMVQFEAIADTDDDSSMGDETPDEVWATVVAPTVGSAPAWGAGLPVSPYSVVNLENGNVTTVLSLTACDPTGPPLHFALVHNSMGYHEDPNDQPAIGSGWRFSYSGRVIGDPNDAYVTVIRDDGTPHLFRNDPNDGFIPPAGVYDTLKWAPSPSDPNEFCWELTLPSLTRRLFDADGHLDAVIDSWGRKLQIARDPNNGDRIDWVISAASVSDPRDPPDPNAAPYHAIKFYYDGNGYLTQVTSPVNGTYRLYYDGNGRLDQVNIPKRDSGGSVNLCVN